MKYLFSGDIQYVKGRKRKTNSKKRILLAFVVIAFVGFSIWSFTQIAEGFTEEFPRGDRPDYSYSLTYDDISGVYSRTEIELDSEGNTLKGYIYSPKTADELIIIAPDISLGADSYIAEIKYFVDHGYMVLVYDSTGCYDSEGDSVVGLSQAVIDLDAVLQYIEDDGTYAKTPIYIYGYGSGGYAAAAVLNYEHEIKAVASIAGYNTPMELLIAWGSERNSVMTYIEYPYIWLYQKYIFGGASNLSAVKGINNTDTPVLLIHGTDDQVVSYEDASIIAHEEELTNENVTCSSYGDDGKNDHDNLTLSEEALAYKKEINIEYAYLLAQYAGDIPDSAMAEWYETIDLEKLTQLDEVFMREIYEFFQSA